MARPFSPLYANMMPSPDPFKYSVRYQRRKTIALHVLGDGALEVRAPVGYRSEWIEDFVRSRSEWAVGARARQLERLQWRRPVAATGEAWLLGRPLQVQMTSAGRFRAVARDGVLEIATPDIANCAVVEKRLERWYRERAIAEFQARLEACCARFPRPVAVPPMTVRRMRRRWGSCNHRGEITFNIDLVKLPPELIDYVVMHEICHLFEFNHGSRFYALQAQAVPDWREHEARLKRY